MRVLWTVSIGVGIIAFTVGKYIGYATSDCAMLGVFTALAGMLLACRYEMETPAKLLEPWEHYVRTVNDWQRYSQEFFLSPAEQSLIQQLFAEGREGLLPNPHTVRVKADGTSDDFDRLRKR